MAAPFDGPGFLDLGSVYLYERNSEGVWNAAITGDLGSSPGHIANPQPQIDDLFGNTLSVSGDILVVAMMKDNPGGVSNAGSVFLYQRGPQGVWAAANTSNLGSIPGNIPNPQPDVSDQFGFSVSVSGGVLAVGANWDDVAGVTNAGSVYLYQRDPMGLWNPANTGSLGSISGHLPDPLPEATDMFGSEVSLADGVLAVSAVGDDLGGIPDAGSVYLYERDPQGLWIMATIGSVNPLAGHIPNPQPQIDSLFGGSISVSGDLLAVGEEADNPQGVVGAGSVHLYQRDDLGAWNPVFTGSLASPEGSIPNPQPQTQDKFGCSVSVSGGVLAVGAFEEP